jgi:conjugal transfer pilus assembly protein TraF
MRGSYRYFSIAMLIGLWISPCLAQEYNFYERSREGWYWYKDEIKGETPKNDEKAVLQKMQPDKFTYQQLWNMNPDRLEAVLTDRQKLAVRDPSEKNVLSYLVVHEIIKRKSAAFSLVATRLAKKLLKPEQIDEKTTAKTPSKINRDDFDQILTANAGNFALLVFERAGCHYCEEQQQAIELFQQTFNWTVKHLDINQYGTMAKQYGIDITPSIIMLSKSAGRAIEISKGLVTFDELKERIIQGIPYLTREVNSNPEPEPDVLQKHLKLAEGQDWGNNP